MRDFTYDQPASRVIFGAGSVVRLGDEIRRLGAHRALILSTPGRHADAAKTAARLGDIAAGVYAEAVMHVHVETVRAARVVADSTGADCYVALGGGSTIGLGKALALETGLPIVAVPTTLAGSEMTAIYGLTEAGRKRTGRDPRVLPRVVIYDPELTLSLPPAIAGPSGMNALAHCVEALYAANTNPIVSLAAVEGIGALARSLPAIVANAKDVDARAEALYGAWLAGLSLNGATMGLHHKLCHTLGGSFNLPHAGVHTVILPHVAAFNRPAVPEVMLRIATAIGGEDDAAQALFDLAVRLGAPVSLKDLGMPEDGLELAAHLATESAYENPRPAAFADILGLLQRAYRGDRPL